MIGSGSRVGKSDYLQRKGFHISFKRNFGVSEETGEQVQNERVFPNAWVAIMKDGLTPQAAADRRSNGSRRSSRNIRSHRAEPEAR